MRWLVLLLLLVPAAAAEVVVARVDGVVTKGTVLHIEDALAEAEARGVPLIIELDTPGGLVAATLDIDDLLAQAQVPVLTYVGPGGGAYAASAGTFLLLMGTPSGMAPGSTIGSAQPVTSGPTGTQNASEKVENFLVGRIRAIAERTDRDPDLAERFVTENLNLGADEALQAGLVVATAADLRTFLVAVDGIEARTGAGEPWGPLDTAGARVIRVEPSFLAGTVDLLSDPTVAFVLFIVGLYALIFGLANAGTYVPETIGAILLLLGLIGLGLFGVSTAGFLLLLLAAVFFVAEVFTPTTGILTAAGVVAMILAGIFLLDGPLLPRGLVLRARAVVLSVAILSGLVTFAVVTLAVKSRHKPPTDAMLGATATVLDPLDPAGRVELYGEVWEARLVDGAAHQDVGAKVRVTARQRLQLTVEPTGPASDPKPSDAGPATDEPPQG